MIQKRFRRGKGLRRGVTGHEHAARTAAAALHHQGGGIGLAAVKLPRRPVLQQPAQFLGSRQALQQRGKAVDLFQHVPRAVGIVAPHGERFTHGKIGITECIQKVEKLPQQILSQLRCLCAAVQGLDHVGKGAVKREAVPWRPDTFIADAAVSKRIALSECIGAAGLCRVQHTGKGLERAGAHLPAVALPRQEHMRKERKFQQKRQSAPVARRAGQENFLKIIRLTFQNIPQAAGMVTVKMGQQKSPMRHTAVVRRQALRHEFFKTALCSREDGVEAAAVHHQHTVLPAQHDALPAADILQVGPRNHASSLLTTISAGLPLW